MTWTVFTLRGAMASLGLLFELWLFRCLYWDSYYRGINRFDIIGQTCHLGHPRYAVPIVSTHFSCARLKAQRPILPGHLLYQSYLLLVLDQNTPEVQ